MSVPVAMLMAKPGLQTESSEEFHFYINPITRYNITYEGCNRRRVYKMSYPILLRSKPKDGYVATALTLSNIEIEAPTREQALARIRQVISDTLAQGEIVDLEISEPKPIITSSFDEIFGMFKDDPTFPKFLDEIEKYRMSRNQEDN